MLRVGAGITEPSSHQRRWHRGCPGPFPEVRAPSQREAEGPCASASVQTRAMQDGPGSRLTRATHELGLSPLQGTWVAPSRNLDSRGSGGRTPGDSKCVLQVDLGLLVGKDTSLAASRQPWVFFASSPAPSRVAHPECMWAGTVLAAEGTKNPQQAASVRDWFRAVPCMV